jgi:hypothetical protein
VVLRVELEALRERGMSFAQAWPIAKHRALADLPDHHRLFWLRTWGEQRSYWQVNYSRARWPAHNRPRLGPVGLQERPALQYFGELIA